MSNPTIYYLEMRSPEALSPKDEAKGLEIRECEVKQHELNRFLYQLVGKDWQWHDKLAWSDEQWREYVADPALRTWVAYFKGAVAGYYELIAQEQGDVEVRYFGLASQFIGRGFGGYLLTQALRSAWSFPGARRVWLHSCNLDPPAALENYKARGMSVYKVESA